MIKLYRFLGVFFSRGDRCTLFPFLALVAPFYTDGLIWMWWSVVAVWCMMGIGVAEGGGVIWWSPTCLREEVKSCAILPLGPMHTDRVRQYPGSPYAAVGGAHQSDRNTTLDVRTRIWIWLLPLGGQATG